VVLLASSTDAQLAADTAMSIRFSWVSSPYVSPGNEAVVSLTVKARISSPVPGPITTSVVSFPAPGINIQIGCSNLSGGITSEWLGDCRMYVDEGPRFGALYQVFALLFASSLTPSLRNSRPRVRSLIVSKWQQISLLMAVAFADDLSCGDINLNLTKLLASI
jgi:hypothetical protein